MVNCHLSFRAGEAPCNILTDEGGVEGIMKQRVDIFAGNAPLHVCDVKAPPECVTKQLCKHTHSLLFTRLDLNRGA